MPIYKSTDGIAKINTTSAIFRGAEMVFGSGLFVSASGGNITTDGDYKIHTFSTPGTSSFTIESIASPNNLNSVEYLIQGGGGSGARIPNATTFASAGAAGGIQTGSFTILPTTYEVIVGVGGTNPAGTLYNGIDGKNSSIFGIIACSGSGGIRGDYFNGGGGSNCVYTGSTAGPFLNGAGASNQANGIDNGDTNDPYINSGSIQDISGTPTEYGRAGRRYNQFDYSIKGSGGNGGNGSNDSTIGVDGVVIVRYQYQ